MKPCSLTQMMDDLHNIVNTNPVQDAPDKLMRHVGTGEGLVGVEALARLLVVESARRRFAEAKLEVRD